MRRGANHTFNLDKKYTEYLLIYYIMCDCGNGTNPRQILNLPATGALTQDQIRKAYLKCSLKCHPDKYKGDDAKEKSQKINGAYETLTKNANYVPPPPPPPPKAQSTKPQPPPKQKENNFKIKMQNYFTMLGAFKYDISVKDIMSQFKVHSLFNSYDADKFRVEYLNLILDHKFDPSYSFPSWVDTNNVTYKKYCLDFMTTIDLYVNTTNNLTKNYGLKKAKEYALQEQATWLIKGLAKNKKEVDDVLRKNNQAPPPNSQKPPSPLNYKDEMKKLLTRLSQRKYNPKVSELLDIEDLIEYAEEYDVDDMMDEYEDPIMDFTLNPDFLPDYSERDYAYYYKEAQKGDDNVKHDYLLIQQVKWIMDLMTKNPAEADVYLRINKQHGDTPSLGDSDQGVNHKKFKLLLVRLSKIDYNPKVSEITNAKKLEELIEFYIPGNAEVIAKYKPLIMNYRLNPEFNDPYDHTENYYKKLLKNIEKLDDNKKKDHIISEQVTWILEALNKSVFGEADEALKYVKVTPPKEPTPPPAPKKPAASQKRCPKGTHRNKKTGECEPTGKKAPPPTKPRSPSPPPPKPAAAAPKPAAATQKRCPKGTRRNKKTGACEPNGKAASAAPEPTKPRTPSPAPAAPQKRCPNGTRRNKKTGACEPK